LNYITEIFLAIWDGLKTTFSDFIDPQSRIFPLYIVSSIALAFYVYYKAKITYPFFTYIFHKKVWLSKSAFVDYKFILFNGLLKVVFIIPFLYAWRYLGVETTFFLEESFGLSTWHLGPTETLIYYSLFLVLLNDIFTYLIHLAMHKIPFLWEFHKIHHSATTLNPITQYRIHPIELFINNFGYLIAASFAMGLFDYLSNNKVDLYLFLGANAFSFLFLVWGASLRHSHVKLKYFNRLENFFLSPYQHQIHHSDNPKHFDKNLGSKLAIWDWIGGTLIRSKNQENIRFGLGKESQQYDSFLKNLYMPFVNITKRVIHFFSA
jgi:sterol desaturase/sphingolipid hydroxylase (fatty acid hydroxylase superfamily)